LWTAQTFLANGSQNTLKSDSQGVTEMWEQLREKPAKTETVVAGD
jgi:hypothetical protein